MQGISGVMLWVMLGFVLCYMCHELGRYMGRRARTTLAKLPPPEPPPAIVTAKDGKQYKLSHCTHSHAVGIRTDGRGFKCLTPEAVIENDMNVIRKFMCESAPQNTVTGVAK